MSRSPSNRRRLARAMVALLPALLVAPIASAQSNAQPCQGPAKPHQTDRLFKVLSAPTPEQEQAFASSGLRKQASTAPHGVLRSTSLCARMRAELKRSLLPTDEPTGGLDQLSLSFVELGDYVGVILSDTRPAARGIRRLGSSPVYLFDKAKVRFVTRLSI